VPGINKQEILRRLKLISQIEPGPESTARAMERVRKVLANMQEKGAEMPGIDEQEILRRLEPISQIEPGPESTAGAMERVRRVLANMQEKKETSKPTGIWGIIPKTRVLRFAAAAIFAIFVLLPLGYGTVRIIKTYFFEEKPTSITTRIATKLSGEGDEYQARKVSDELNRLKDAGKYEKTLMKEWVENGILHRKYSVRYVLANGEVVTENEHQIINATNDTDADQSEDKQ